MIQGTKKEKKGSDNYRGREAGRAHAALNFVVLRKGKR